MNELLIKDVLLNGNVTDVLVRGNRIASIGVGLECRGKVIAGTGKAVLPPFYNTHTHAAMTLLRGYADDMELFKWLNEYIWPAEAKLTEEDVYWGTRLAIVEMIRSGTVFFSDMYWLQQACIRAAEDMKVRAAAGMLFLADGDADGLFGRNAASNREVFERRGEFSSRIILTLAPHAIYTVSEKDLRKSAELSEEYGMMVHMHLAETEKEAAECRAEHGLSPVEYLKSLGLLNERLLAAHCVAFSDRDFELFAESGGWISHMPCSNFKLCSGMFRWKRAMETGCNVTIGTDGCASNNNLSMFEEMKFAALLGKLASGDPSAAPARQVFSCASGNGARAFGIDAGEIAEGRLADLMLVDMDNTMLCGGNLLSDIVYSADSSCVDTVICDGNILMENRVIENEMEIVAEAKARRIRLTGK